MITCGTKPYNRASSLTRSPRRMLGRYIRRMALCTEPSRAAHAYHCEQLPRLGTQGIGSLPFTGLSAHTGLTISIGHTRPHRSQEPGTLSDLPCDRSVGLGCSFDVQAHALKYR